MELGVALAAIDAANAADPNLVLWQGEHVALALLQGRLASDWVTKLGGGEASPAVVIAARAHRVPFYVAFPESTVDWTIKDGVAEIPIEQRDAREVTHVTGGLGNTRRGEVRLTPEGTAARNDAFDVTPARYITAFITERGVCRASASGLRRLFRREKI